MREIKFRCWHENKFVYPDCVGTDEYMTYCVENIYELDPEIFYCDDITQYIGMKDKNGVDIYEGDLVKFKDWKPKVIAFNDEMCTCLGFCLANTYKALYSFDSEDLEVVGNIYENDLL